MKNMKCMKIFMALHGLHVVQTNAEGSVQGLTRRGTTKNMKSIEIFMALHGLHVVQTNAEAFVPNLALRGTMKNMKFHEGLHGPSRPSRCTQWTKSPSRARVRYGP